MKILHVSDVFVRHGGGAPNVIFELAKKQVKEGHMVVVATFQHKSDWPSAETIEGVQVRCTPLKDSRLPFYFSGYRNMARLGEEIVDQLRPDVIHAHMPFSGVAVCDAADRLTKNVKTIPVVYTFHGGWASEYLIEAATWKKRVGVVWLEWLLMRLIEKKMLLRANIISTLSRFMQIEAQKYLVNPRNGWRVIPSGVDLDRFRVQTKNERDRFKSEHQIPPQAFFVFTARRLVRRMGLGELLNAIEIAKYEIPDLYLVIGGKGGLDKELESQIKELGVEGHVRLEGFIDDQNLPGYFATADLFVLPTQAYEGFGLIILESMASGTPVIGTPVGAISEVVGGFKTELLTESRSEKDIAAKIIEYYQDTFLQGDAEIRNSARKYAEKFSWWEMANQYQELYEEVLKG